MLDVCNVSRKRSTNLWATAAVPATCNYATTKPAFDTWADVHTRKIALGQVRARALQEESSESVV